MVIGLTGGIGSGKTTVSKYLEIIGCKLYNTDDKAKHLYFVPEIKEKIIELLGKEIYISDVNINKDLIFDIIFNDSEKLDHLNRIFIPYIKKDLITFLDKCDSKDIIIVESAILFETGMHKLMYKNIIVVAPKEERIQRVMKRNSVSRDKVIACMDAQWPDEKKIQISDFVINNINISEMEAEANHIINILMK